MVKLKTLREIIWELMQSAEDKHPANVEIHLRQEAINQINKLNDFGSSPEVELKIFSWEINTKRTLTLTEREILISWIKYFFNITEGEIND